MLNLTLQALSRFQFVFLADQLTVLVNKMCFKHQDLRMFCL